MILRPIKLCDLAQFQVSTSTRTWARGANKWACNPTVNRWTGWPQHVGRMSERSRMSGVRTSNRSTKFLFTNFPLRGTYDLREIRKRDPKRSGAGCEPPRAEVAGPNEP